MDTNVVFSVVGIVLGLAVACFVLFAISHVVASHFTLAVRAAWVMGIVLVPLVGATAWFIWRAWGAPGASEDLVHTAAR